MQILDCPSRWEEKKKEEKKQRKKPAMLNRIGMMGQIFFSMEATVLILEGK